MFEILDNQGNVIETATSFTQAATVVTYLDNKARAAAPYHCRPMAA